ncbi:MAG TPA: hypothetical protein VGN51_11870 [Acidimicrobiia bacterium]|jgi:hypothetical protein
MSDLGDELRSTIEGAAPPVTLDELATRGSRREQPRRGAPWRTFVAGLAAAALVIVGAVVVVNLGDDEPAVTHIAAPTVVVGDIDLAVLSTSFDGDGARGAVPTDVVDTVRAIPGISGVQGAMQRFVDVVRTDTSSNDPPDASERSAIAISWEEGAPLAFGAGGPPQQTGEIAINQSLAAQYQVGVGDDLVVRTGSTMGGAVTREVRPDGSVVVGPGTSPDGATMHVVGVFTPAGGDIEDMNLVVMQADELAAATNKQYFDRVDIVAAHDVPIDELLDRVSAALPPGLMVVPPSVVGFDEQLRAELEIQRAYHWVLNPNHDLGHDATFGQSDDPATAAQNLQNYDENYWQTKNTELRVSRVAFVDNTTALATYRAYYGGMPSSVVNQPMTGVAELIDGQWKLSAAGLCELSRAAHVGCAGGGGPTAATVVAPPPDGWNAVDSVAGLADGFQVLASPTSTVAQRVDVVDRGDQLRDAIAAGAKSDVSRANVSFTVSGARLLDPTHAQILYSLIADGEPHLETPYPLVGNAVLVDGAWKVASRYACGLNALATLSCPAAAALPTSTTAPTTTSTTRPTVTTDAPSTVPPTTDPDSVEVPTTLLVPTSTAP